MLVYGGEVSRTPPDLSNLASVAPMAPRVFLERLGEVSFDIFGLIGRSKVRNLGCGMEVEYLIYSYRGT